MEQGEGEKTRKGNQPAMRKEGKKETVMTAIKCTSVASNIFSPFFSAGFCFYDCHIFLFSMSISRSFATQNKTIRMIELDEMENAYANQTESYGQNTVE